MSYYNNYDDSLIPFISTHDITPKVIPRYHLNAELYKCIKILSEKVVTPPPPSFGSRQHRAAGDE